MNELTQEWFARDAVAVARDLLGKEVRYGPCRGVIVETEAYTTDGASHGRTRTKRSSLMHDTYGHWYIYFTYGMHYCANVTTNKDSVGAVLIRAVEPIAGITHMQERRGTRDLTKLASGPARFCQAFGITKVENGLPVGGDFAIYDAPAVSPSLVAAAPRIGITRDRELPWRFYIIGNPHVSRK